MSSYVDGWFWRNVCQTASKYQEVSSGIEKKSEKSISTLLETQVERESQLQYTQGLIAAKSRLAKQGLTIPRQELVSAHMSTNLVHNVKEALQGFPVSSVHCWLDSSVALHWIRGDGEYKQFVRNRVVKIQDKAYIQWRHVRSEENPADLGSRGGEVEQSSALWLKGPKWLPNPDEWPPNIVTGPTKDTQAEAKLVKEVLAVAVATESELDGVISKHEFWKAIRIAAWAARFVQNCRTKKVDRSKGPLTTEETEKQIKQWIQRIQEKSQKEGKIEEDKLRLNLQKNEDGLLECRGRIQGHYPVYLPDGDIFTEKLVMNAHKRTLHGGVGLTMADVRQEYWVPRLRRLAKRVVKSCNGCKRFQAVSFAHPPVGNLPRDRTEGSAPFQVVGVDFAGPIKYRARNKSEKKAYIVLYACSLTRGLYLELLPSLNAQEFIPSLKRLVARRGRPKKLYSDNGKTFVAAAKWVKNAMKNEKLQDWLARQKIKWQFNLSRAPWWGGQFERLVGLVKQAMYKSIGNGNLQWKELEEVILDVETALNNRPLNYVDEDIQLPLLTPNVMLFG